MTTVVPVNPNPRLSEIVGSGLTDRRREDLDDPKENRHLRDLAQHGPDCDLSLALVGHRHLFDMRSLRPTGEHNARPVKAEPSHGQPEPNMRADRDRAPPL